VKVISYEEWKRQVELAHKDDEPVQCEECCGEGHQECDLGHEHECQECDGLGNVPAADTSRRAYANDLASDLQAMLDWCGKIPAEIESSSGLSMAVYSDIKTRKLRIVA
tara:strand:- start:17674 stop:18000 length:327 start_codon:yes stop_codon:yes gene_type:complete